MKMEGEERTYYAQCMPSISTLYHKNGEREKEEKKEERKEEKKRGISICSSPSKCRWSEWPVGRQGVFGGVRDVVCIGNQVLAVSSAGLCCR